MHMCGSSKGRRLGQALLLLFGFAAVAVAAETCTQDIPDGDAYVVTAVLVPGQEGAEVLGEKGEDHVDFRIGFGADLALSVNGAAAGAFDPGATYSVTVSCQRVGPHWVASTVVVNESTGEVTYCQANYKMPGAAETARAMGECVVALNVQ